MTGTESSGLRLSAMKAVIQPLVIVTDMKLKWIVEFEVDISWIADGFNLNDERALSMLSRDLSYANIGMELDARVMAAPDAKIIEGLQGGSLTCYTLFRDDDVVFETFNKDDVRSRIAATELGDDEQVDLLDGKTVWGPDGSRYTLEESA